MADLAERLAVDRRHRDAAWALCRADVEFIREDLAKRSVVDRVTDRIGEGATELADEALEYAERRPYMAGGIAAAVLWVVYRFLFGSDDD